MCESSWLGDEFRDDSFMDISPADLRRANCMLEYDWNDTDACGRNNRWERGWQPYWNRELDF